MANFYYELMCEISDSLFNDYKNNYYSFKPQSQKKILRNTIKGIMLSSGFIYRSSLNDAVRKFKTLFGDLDEEFDRVYNFLENQYSKDIMVKILAFRILGYSKVKIFDSDLFSDEKMSIIKDCENKKDSLKVPGTTITQLFKYDLSKISKNIQLYYLDKGVYIDFILEQYAYKRKGIVIDVNKGDYVIDAGGCWGDTALYFADKIGNEGKVFSFEFISSNIDVYQKNIAINPQLEPRINLVSSPLWSKSDKKLYYRDKGPASIVSFEKKQGYDDEVSTICIDDYIANNNISKIDYMKMDIEGAEIEALKGAESVIRKYRPKLAISVYHNGHRDLATVPLWLKELDLGYRFYLDHFTPSDGETMLFAISHEKI